MLNKRRRQNLKINKHWSLVSHINIQLWLSAQPLLFLIVQYTAFSTKSKILQVLYYLLFLHHTYVLIVASYCIKENLFYWLEVNSHSLQSTFIFLQASIGRNAGGGKWECGGRVPLPLGPGGEGGGEGGGATNQSQWDRRRKADRTIRSMINDIFHSEIHRKREGREIYRKYCIKAILNSVTTIRTTVSWDLSFSRTHERDNSSSKKRTSAAAASDYCKYWKFPLCWRFHILKNLWSKCCSGALILLCQTAFWSS
jgi:hypothetical protein